MDISQVTELVENTAYPLMVEGYATLNPLYPELCEVVPTDGSIYGDKGQTLTGMGRFKERPDNTATKADQFAPGKTWYARIPEYSTELILPERMVRATDAAARIRGLVSQMARSWGENSINQKEDFIADMFQKGTLTAGSQAFFDGSFPSEVDPNPAFIYDGLPWFDTAHTRSVDTGTWSNHTVTSPLTAANLQTARILTNSTNAIDARGERIRLKHNTLVVPPGLQDDAATILNTLNAPGSANNDINPVAGAYNLRVWEALDDAASAASWWTGEAGKGIRVYDSGRPTLDVYMHEPTKAMHVRATYYFGAVVTDALYWAAFNKAAA